MVHLDVPNHSSISANGSKKAQQQLRLLNELSTKLQSLLQSDDFYSEIVKLIQTHFQYYSIQILTAGPNDTVTLRAQAGAYSEFLKLGLTLKNSEAGITGFVIKNKKSYIANDIGNDPLFTSLSLPVRTKSQICVPIMKDDEVIATLNVESDELNAFDSEDKTTLEAVASQITVSITNRKLYTQVKDFNLTLQKVVEEKTHELREAHERILQQQALLEKENKALKTLVKSDKGVEIIGQSPALLNIVAMAEKIAPTTATVLIQGESGTGKELIARLLHFRSDRAHQAYVTVNCGALQEALLESELFGHEKGSFTGAVTQKIGLAELADGGTLFLDEIGEMSLGIQSKLLRFLQEGEFYRIGGKKNLKVNVRVISATNRDLELEVKEGRFREDLYYRLNTITLRMPPLRERREDIPVLAEYFMANSRFGGGGHAKRIDPRVIEVLSQYDWPGNIRELQNIIERMKILAENHEIKLEDVPYGIRFQQATEDKGLKIALDMTLDDVERSHILGVLESHHGNKTKTAQSLGITIKTLYNKLHRYGVLPNSSSPHESAGSA